ncbi:hypothetical protein GPK34_12295 [Secundilactobacillus kimchicus]|uniref:hypothetical protein n=1 Tax=Secundilactobacillus kimchicus TaxID=528209 RepID=UPI001C0304FD|nr:hypothetical protein [Secundilactobacillus kimchicus]MBT9672808.1 hypothetical protein [Secundilactobacillus kimchicus]
MNNVKIVSLAALATLGVSFAATPLTAAAKTNTTPRAIRGTWYSKSGSGYDTMAIKTTGIKWFGVNYKLKAKVTKTKFSHSKSRSKVVRGNTFYKVKAFMSPYYMRVSKVKVNGKYRKALLMYSNGLTTAYFSNKINQTYHWAD